MRVRAPHARPSYAGDGARQSLPFSTATSAEGRFAVSQRGRVGRPQTALTSYHAGAHTPARAQGLDCDNNQVRTLQLVAEGFLMPRLRWVRSERRAVMTSGKTDAAPCVNGCQS